MLDNKINYMKLFDNTNLTEVEKQEIQGMIDVVTKGDQEAEKAIELAFQNDQNLIYSLRDILIAKRQAVQSGNKEELDKIFAEEEKILESLNK